MAGIVSKAQFGAVSRYAKAEIATATSALNAAEISVRDLKTTLIKLNSYQSRIVELSEKLLGTLDPAEIEPEVEKQEKLKVDLIDIIARIDTYIAGQENDRDSTAGSHVSGSRVDGFRSSPSVKLPKLNIPPFDGDILKFQEFWDAFESSIHNNESLNPVEKFNYLRSYLRGDARNLVAGYTTTAANYESVISILKQRFGNKELIIYNHVNSLICLQSTGSQVQDLQRTTDKCERHIRSLVNLGLEEETFGRVFVPILMSKLTTGIRISLHKKQSPGHCWALPELRKALQHKIYARETGNICFGTGQPSSHNTQQRSRDRIGWKRDNTSKPSSASTLFTNSKANTRSSEKRCRFCEQDHYSTDCRKYPDIESRKKVLGNCCFKCLGKQHSAAQCRTTRSCFYCKSPQHHSSLCNVRFGNTTNSKSSGTRSSQFNVESHPTTSYKTEQPPKVTTTIFSHGRRGILQTALVSLRGPKGTYNARVLFDNGASNAFISNQVAAAIGARKVGKESISLAGFQDEKRRTTAYTVHDFCIQLPNGQTRRILAYGINTITCPIERYAINVEDFPLITKIKLADPPNQTDGDAEIDLLLGSGYYYDFVKSERRTMQNGLILLDSEFGYILAGSLEDHSSKTTQLLLTRSQCPDSNFDLERLWKLEEVGICDPTPSNDDEIALAAFNKTLEFNAEEQRYFVKWPMKEENPEIPDNYQLALGRLKSMINRLQTNPAILQQYDDIIAEQMKKGVIELAPAESHSELVHYIPHHAVVTPTKTTKLRIVYDASCKMNKSSPSLNECLHRGPVMLQDLCGLLLRFRTNKVAILSDVEKAFLQIGLQEPDRNLVRFLWMKDPRLPFSKKNLVHYRFRRVCFGVIASPFLLAGVAAHHLQKINSNIAKDIHKDIYVDNVVTGADSVAKAVSYYHEAKQLFKSQ